MSAHQPHELLMAASAPAAANLVAIVDGQPVTTTLKVAAGTATTHEAAIKLVRTYLGDMEEFGLVRFEIAPRSQGQHGGGDTEYAVLNEEQSALLLAYMRNTEIVRQFKKALIRDFFQMRRTLATPDPDIALPPEHQAIVALLYENAAMKAKQTQIEAAQTVLQQSVARIEAKQSAFEEGAAYFTVIGYGQMRGIKFSLSEASTMGRKAGSLSKANGISVDKVRDPRFGQVNSYHESMLDKALDALYGSM